MAMAIDRISERELIINGIERNRAVARFVWGGGSWGNINLSILQNFKIEKNCIANFSKCFANSLLMF